MANSEFALPEGTRTIALGIGDLNGIMRGKRITAEQWPNVCESGVALSIAMFATDMTSDIWDTPYVNMDNGYPDMHLFPNSPVRTAPWEEGCAFCFGKALGMDHEPVPIDPRGTLVAQVERANGMGYQVSIGAELEFYLLDPETCKPRDVGNQFYGLLRASELEPVLGPIRSHLSAIGIPIEQSNPEYAPGQVEVNMHYCDALQAADNVVAFRSLVKEIAAKHGFLATFMAKPFALESGSGFHTHHSLWKDGTNIFASKGRLSGIGRNYLAGVQLRMPETALSASTTPNAYRRRRPYTFCPTNNCWGYDNRTVALRVLEGSSSSTRVEKRDGSADCNPYYLLACEIAAGLDGIEQGLEPEHFAEFNGYDLEGAAPLPANIEEAINCARGSGFMKRLLGSDRLEILIGQAERERDFVLDQVTQVEIDRYLRNF
ncbi:MAG: glutamine synthetase family protein [Albidovulum sp.]|nr:glutamine synthetase family protein [Albidovulum sp.]MDE0530060.1 glutamine synthetase family protein [Albidovulum sp.]